MTYNPVLSVITVRLAPVSVWVAVTWTSGTTAPVGSVTVPLIWATSCAHAPAETRKQMQASAYARVCCARVEKWTFMCPSPPLTRGSWGRSRYSPRLVVERLFGHARRCRRAGDNYTASFAICKIVCLDYWYWFGR